MLDKGVYLIRNVDLWRLHGNGATVCVTTNGETDSWGCAIMGAGTAAQAAERFPDLPRKLGEKLRAHGNHLYYFPEYRLITFPTKRAWRERSDPALIRASAERLMSLLDKKDERGGALVSMVYLPMPGCGAGGLKWEAVRPLLSQVIDQRVVVVHGAPGVGQAVDSARRKRAG
jgi:hypothetical protein